MGLKTRYQSLIKNSTATATARINEFLGFKNVAESGLMTITAIKELEEAVPGNERESAPSRAAIVSDARAAEMAAAGRRGADLRGGVRERFDARALTSRSSFLARDGALRREVAASRFRIDGANKPKLLSEADVTAVATDFKRRELGKGIARLAEAIGEDLFKPKGGGARLANSGIALEVDLFALKSDGRQFKKFAEMVGEAIESDKFDELKELLAEHLER